jgi:predicted nucleic acid-binding protein
MKTVFADTFYFLAQLNPSDQAHGKAVAFTSGHPVGMVTTEWVLTELADGLARSRRGRLEFMGTLADLQADANVAIVPCGHGLLAEGVQLYASRPDKEWSLTDCISFVDMTKQGILEALTGDHHFEQAGFVALLN